MEGHSNFIEKLNIENIKIGKGECFVMKKNNSFKTFLLVCIFTLSIPLFAFANEIETVEPLGAGTWDQIFYGSLNVGTSITRTENFTSGGGDIRVCVQGIDIGNKISFQFAKSSGAVGPPFVYDNQFGTSVSSDYCFSKLEVSGKVTLHLTANGLKSSDTVWVRIED